jgi:hypothetical protein
MFRPLYLAIFRWINKLLKGSTIYTTDPLCRIACFSLMRSNTIRGLGSQGWGSLKWDSEVLSEFCGTCVPEAMVWVHYRPILSSERVPNMKKHNCQTEKKNLVMSCRWEPNSETDWPTDRLTGGRNLTSASVQSVSGLSWLSQSRVLSSCCWESLVDEAKFSSGTQRKGNIRRWKPLPSNG